MSKTSFAIKIDTRILRALKEFCSLHGTKYSFFVEKAIQQKLAEEELKEDLLDFKKLKSEETQATSFEEYLEQRDV